MEKLAVLGVAAGFVAQAAGEVPGWVGTAVSVPFLAGLWWTERKARERAEERERAVLTSSAEKVYGAIASLTKATEVLDSYARQKG